MRNLIQNNFLSDLKQYQCTILQFWKSEVRNESRGTKIKVSSGLHLRWRKDLSPYPLLRVCLCGIPH